MQASQSSLTTNDTMNSIQLNDYQKMLFPYAYNILASAEDARDAIQDVMTSFLSADTSGIENVKGYLVRSVINQSINLKKRRRSVSPDQVWLPEPVATERTDDNLHRTDTISYSMLVLLERLNARERAVFILKEAFDYSHQDIAAVLSCTVDNSRQLLSRAKSKLGAMGKVGLREMYPQKKTHDFFARYIQVIRSSNVQELESLLAKEVTVETDGGKLKIVSAFTQGVGPAAGLLDHVFRHYQKDYTIALAEVNHQPALMFYSGQKLTNCMVFDIDPRTGLIRHVYSVVDPHKLKNLEQTAKGVAL